MFGTLFQRPVSEFSASRMSFVEMQIKRLKLITTLKCRTDHRRCDKDQNHQILVQILDQKKKKYSTLFFTFSKRLLLVFHLSMVTEPKYISRICFFLTKTQKSLQLLMTITVKTKEHYIHLSLWPAITPNWRTIAHKEAGKTEPYSNLRDMKVSPACDYMFLGHLSQVLLATNYPYSNIYTT